MKQKIQNFFKEIGIISFSLTLSLVAFMGYSIAKGWVEPTTAPPGGNLGAPINTSGFAQLKSGALGVDGLLATRGGLAVGTVDASSLILNGIRSQGDICTNAGRGKCLSSSGSTVKYNLSQFVWWGGIEPPVYSYTFTAQKSGRVIILAKGDIAGYRAGEAYYDLAIDGTLADRARSNVWNNHAGSRSFSLMGEYTVVNNATYTVTIRCSINNEVMYYPRVLVLYSD